MNHPSCNKERIELDLAHLRHLCHLQSRTHVFYYRLYADHLEFRIYLGRWNDISKYLFSAKTKELKTFECANNDDPRMAYPSVDI